MSRATQRLRVGVAGLGRAFTLMLPTFAGDERIELVAAADPREEALERFASEFQARTYRSVEKLLDDSSVEVVYIATPHPFHVEHVRLAASKGKHVLVEKPMALTLDECRSMVAAARAAGVHLIVGHSHSFNAPILRTREIIERGDVGRVRMISALNFTDFLYRPRRPEELVTAQGGGVVFSQAAHQIDIVRLLGGGRVRSVRASTGAWDAARPTEGAYSAFLTFEDGAFATVVYSGYGHFDSDEFSGWIGEMGQMKDPAQYGLTRNTLRNSADEASLKSARNYGGPEYKTPSNEDKSLHQHFGTVIVSCERADLRPLPSGVMVYGDSARKLEALPVPHVPRSEVIDELYDAVVSGRAPLHSGEWAAATLEVCLAMLRSAREQKEVSLENQIALPTR
jgi:phthalate 4,5-cis-dihydrodiol dehydrogenase